MIYLDNAASTRPFPEILKVQSDTAFNTFGNPSSLHTLGVNAAALLQSCREYIGNMANLPAESVIFTSGATEANQMVLKHAVRNSNKKRNHILMSEIEHSSSLAAIYALTEKGYEVELLKPDPNGTITSNEIQAKLRPTTELVSIMGVHNELGTIQNIPALNSLIKSINPKTLFHVDSVQWFGKFPLPAANQLPDYMTFSGHKFHATRGIGGVIKKPDAPLRALIDGGGQERKLRSGTENLPAISALVEALKLLKKTKSDHISQLQKTLHTHVINHPNYVWLGHEPGPNRSPYINLIAVKNQKSEILIHKLEGKNIYVSSGSACSEKAAKSHTSWSFLNIDKNLLDNILRVSFSVMSTQNEVEEFLKELDHIS